MKPNQIACNWLPAIPTGNIDDGGIIFADEFPHDYATRFANQFGCDVNGVGRPMHRVTNSAGFPLSISVSVGKCSNDYGLVVARQPICSFLGKCGGLKDSYRNRSFYIANRRHSWRRYKQ